MIVVQHDDLTRSRLNTIIVVPITSTLSLSTKRWTVVIPATGTGLSHESIATVHLLYAIDRSRFTGRVGELPDDVMQQLDHELMRTLDLFD